MSTPARVINQDIELSGPEIERLGELEQVIEKGSQAFIEVGMALVEIRDSRLYRSEYRSFEDYCQRKWGFGRNYGHKLIRSAHLAVQLMDSPEVGTSGTQIGYKQALALAEAAEPVGVLKEASAEGKPTVKKIRSIVDAIKHRAMPVVEMPDSLMAASTAALGTTFDVYSNALAVDRPWSSNFVIYAPDARLSQQFADAITTSIERGDLGNGIFFAHPSTTAEWFHKMIDVTGGITILRTQPVVVFGLNVDVSQVFEHDGRALIAA